MLILKELPDISKWNICDVNNISGLFFGCSSLKELPDISKWNYVMLMIYQDYFMDVHH